MKKYIKYIAFTILIALAIAIIWFFFIKKNPAIEQYEKGFEEKLNHINEVKASNNDDLNEYEQPQQTINPIIDETTVKPNDGQIIISSETKVLNQQGQELLDELSKQLEESFETISTTTGVVDDDVLNKELEIKVGE